MKGILFTPDMHEAIREGRKTVTRRESRKTVNQDRSCLQCSRVSYCPIIELWIKLTEAPIEATKFYCSEFELAKLPCANGEM